MAPTGATADDRYKYTPVFMPKCAVYEMDNGVEICGFEASVWFEQVLTVDAELVHEKAQLKNERLRTLELTKQVGILQGQIIVHVDSESLLLAREAKLTQQLIAKDKELQDARVKSSRSGLVPWTIAAVSVAVLTGLIVKASID